MGGGIKTGTIVDEALGRRSEKRAPRSVPEIQYSGTPAIRFLW